MALKIQREGITGLMVTYPSSPLSIFVDYGETQIWTIKHKESTTKNKYIDFAVWAATKTKKS